MRPLALTLLLLPACSPAADVGEIQAAGGMLTDTRGVFVSGARPATPTQVGLYLMQLDSSAATRIAGGDGVLTLAPQLVGDDNFVYFAAQQAGAWGVYQLGRQEGAAPLKLAASDVQPGALAIDGANLYWSVSRSGSATGDVLRVPLTGGSPQAALSGVLAPLGLAVDASNVYWTAQDPAKLMWKRGGVWKAPLAGGGAPAAIAGDLTEPAEVAVAGDAVIAVDAGSPTSGCSSSGGSIVRAPIAGTTGTALDTDLQGVGGLVVGGGNAWYRTGFACGKPAENASVWRIPSDGGHATPIAQNLVGPSALAVDDKYVYWTAVGTGTTNHAVLRRAGK